MGDSDRDAFGNPITGSDVPRPIAATAGFPSQSPASTPAPAPPDTGHSDGPALPGGLGRLMSLVGLIQDDQARSELTAAIAAADDDKDGRVPWTGVWEDLPADLRERISSALGPRWIDVLMQSEITVQAADTTLPPGSAVATMTATATAHTSSGPGMTVNLDEEGTRKLIGAMSTFSALPSALMAVFLGLVGLVVPFMPSIIALWLGIRTRRDLVPGSAGLVGVAASTAIGLALLGLAISVLVLVL